MFASAVQLASRWGGRGGGVLSAAAEEAVCGTWAEL